MKCKCFEENATKVAASAVPFLLLTGACVPVEQHLPVEFLHDLLLNGLAALVL